MARSKIVPEVTTIHSKPSKSRHTTTLTTTPKLRAASRSVRKHDLHGVAKCAVAISEIASRKKAQIYQMRPSAQAEQEETGGERISTPLYLSLGAGFHSISTAGKGQAQVRWGVSHFAGGSEKFAYRGKYIRGPFAGQPCVVKRLKLQTNKSNVPPEFIRDLEVTHLAQSLTVGFNLMPDVSRALRFNMPIILRVASASVFSRNARTGEFVLVEPMIQGHFDKFVSNNGNVLSTGTLSSFSHWTWHATNGNFLVVDLQGVAQANMYVLTDASVHSKRAEQYGALDHGWQGVVNFFATHRCTNICREFDSPHIPEHVLQAARTRIHKKKEDGDWVSPYKHT